MDRRHEASRERNYRRRDDDYEDNHRSGRSRYDRDERSRNRSRSRSTSRDRKRVTRSRSPKRDEDRKGSFNERRPEQKDVEMKQITKKDVIESEEPLDEDAQLAAFLGITSFASTKGQKVAGNQVNSAVDSSSKKKKREYRQYLFVKGAYDIPLTKDQLEAKAKEQQ